MIRATAPSPVSLTIHRRNNLPLRIHGHIWDNNLSPIRARHPYNDRILPEARLIVPLKVVVILPHSLLPRLSSVGADFKIGYRVVTVQHLEGETGPESHVRYLRKYTGVNGYVGGRLHLQPPRRPDLVAYDEPAAQATRDDIKLYVHDPVRHVGNLPKRVLEKVKSVLETRGTTVYDLVTSTLAIFRA